MVKITPVPTMVKKFSVPRGTSDILPSDIHLWHAVEAKTRQTLNNYNYKEIRTPIFEETELFARSMGQTSDIVQKQMLNLTSQKKKGVDAGKLSGLSLRPESTASIVRSYIQHNLDKKESLSKLYYIGPMFRGERPQKGRLRQFHQIGVEAIGPQTLHPYLDAEVIALCVHILNNLGLKDFILKINTLGTLQDKEKFSKLLRKELKSQVPNLCDDCKQRFERNVFRILDCKNRTCCAIVDELNIGHSYLSVESRDYYVQVKEALDSLGIQYKELPNLVRGLDYYTHTVFEICDSSLGSQDALGAGGRYNHLVSQLGGPQVDAIGFALGIERILLAIPQNKTAVVQSLEAYIIALDDNSFKKAFHVLNILRREGITCDINYRISSVKSQMRAADKSGAKSVIILGEDELKRQCVTLKDMEMGSQKEVSIKDDDYAVLTEVLRERQR